ncbi:MAG TPA: zinc-binding dehydrogenase [Planctomycetota bacterium]
MRKVVLEEFGAPEVLRVGEHPDPPLAEGGYRIEARAIALNFADTLERQGRYGRDQAVPMEMGKEAAGVVVERGPAARRFEIGAPVIVIKFGNGCYAERIVAAESEVLEPPAGFSFPEMAAFGTAFGTAWFALTEVARVRPGESALVQAAAGGLGGATVLLARSLGLDPVIGSAGGPGKCAYVEALGATRCVDYRSADFRAAVRELTGGRGVDFVLESVGGEVYERSLEVVAPLGRLVVLGFSSVAEDPAGSTPRIHPLSVFHRSLCLCGLNVHNLRFHERRSVWAALVAHVEQHGLRPPVGLELPFADVAAGHAALEGRRTTGKVILLP